MPFDQNGGEKLPQDTILRDIAGEAFDQLAAADSGVPASPDPAPAADPKAGSISDTEKTDPKAAASERARASANRDQFGRFRPAQKAPAANTDNNARPNAAIDPAKPAVDPAAVDPAKAGSDPAAPDAAAALGAPPPGWSIKAKAEWDKLPAHVRADIAKRESEIANGFREYEGIKPFATRARQSGQTLAQALHAYTGIEDLIRRDPGAGLMHIAQNAGLTQFQAGQLFATLASRLGTSFAPGNQNAPGGSPADQNAGADPRLLDVIAPAVQPLAQRLQSLETMLSSQAEADRRQRLTASASVVEQFRSDPAHRYYDNVEQGIADLLERGVVARTGNPAADLQRAYEMATYANPEIRELLINEQLEAKAREREAQAREAVSRARNASRSISGAPSPGAKLPTEKLGPGDTLRQHAERAYDAMTV